MHRVSQAEAGLLLVIGVLGRERRRLRGINHERHLAGRALRYEALRHRPGSDPGVDGVLIEHAAGSLTRRAFNAPASGASIRGVASRGPGKKIPYSTWILGVLGAGALLRAVWHPSRALVAHGAVTDCAGPDGQHCDPSLALGQTDGSSVYATGGGRVLSVGPSWVHIGVGNEPVILHYSGLAPKVKEGQYVWRGQVIGRSSAELRFAVFGISGGALQPIEPAAWLAARGYRISKKGGGKKLWCEGGRHLEIPKEAYQTCKLGLPERASFSLLPVSIEQV